MTTVTRLAAWAAVAMLTSPGPAPALAADAPAERSRARTVFTIGSDEITESSSLAASTTRPGLVYTTNDSGDGPVVYVLDGRSGRLVGRTRLVGVEPTDIEALSAASDGSLVVGDVGDNGTDREHVSAYRIRQPGPGERDVRADRVVLRYTDGPRDAESVLYDDRTGRVFVVTKEFNGASVYRTRRHVFERKRAVLRPIAPAPSVATDATFVEGRRFAVVRTYVDATVYRFPSWRRVRELALPAQEQGESVTWPGADRVIWVGSEGERSDVLAVRLPRLSPRQRRTTPRPATSSSPSNDSAARDRAVRRAGQTKAVIVVASGLLAAVLVAGLVLEVRARRRHRRGV